MVLRCGFAAAVFLNSLVAGLAAEPVRTIAIEVQPYFSAVRGRGGRPHVAVASSVNAKLASSRREDIVAVRDEIAANPRAVTPLTLMVLAIRLYDVGLRDEAVTWFYAAKTRFLVLAAVVDIKAAGLQGMQDAIHAFAYLAGPVINGYAFCDLSRQQAAQTAALDWVEKNPYTVMFMARLPARPGGRRANARRAIAQARDNAGQERAYFAEATNAAEFFATRKANGADAKYCWGS